MIIYNADSILEFNNALELFTYIVDNRIAVFCDGKKYQRAYIEYVAEYQRQGFKVYHCRQRVFERIKRDLRSL